MSKPGLWAVKIACIAGMAALPLVVDSYWLNMLTLALIYSLAVFSINVLTGFTGLLSFGQAGFVGLGAYTYGVLSVSGSSPAIAALAGVALPTAVGLLLALPAARLKGHYLAIGTLGFGVLIAQLLNNWVGVTRGPMGLLGIRSIGLGRSEWFYVALGVSLLIVTGLNILERRTFLGLVLKSVKHDEIVSGACGIPVFAVKLFAFCLSALLAGLCGVLLAANMRFLTPDLFGTEESFRYLMIAVIGGVGSATGGLLSALVLTVIPEVLRTLGETNVRLLVYGMMVLFALWFLPAGIGGLIERGVRGRPQGGATKETGRLVLPGLAASKKGDAPATAILELRGVSKSFGGVQALQSVDLAGLPGEVHGLIGPNGAGKSTLLGCITGVSRINAGEIVFRGRRIDRLPAHRRARLGIGRTFQKIRLAGELTVFENVAVGLAAQRLSRISRYLRVLTPLSAAAIAETVSGALDAAGIADSAGETVASLPYGTRHNVEVARSLVAQPDVLLLDEPATGLTGEERRRLGVLVRRIAESGCLVILVEHDLAFVGELCDRVTVIEYGRRIFTGTPVEAQNDPAVVKAYLGSAKFVKREERRAEAT